MKVAILSNINADYIVCTLEKEYDIVPSVGYGNVWGQLLDESSSLNMSNPNVLILITDIEFLLDKCRVYDEAVKIIDEWFAMFDVIVKRDKDYFVSDVIFRSDILSDNDSFYEEEVEHYWLQSLKARVKNHSNIHVLKLNQIIKKVGKKNIFSEKLWYIGKIPYSNEGARHIADAIKEVLNLLNKTIKKVLIFDLDNTLWGGILGEDGLEGIKLSDDHIGAVYKTVQQQIGIIKQLGVLLAISSKNSESDVQEVWDKHPYMLLKRNDFAAIKINWDDKADNIRDIAKELNLGMDSLVFIDDMPAERDNIRRRVPDVIVPEFPEKLESYPDFIVEVFNRYFKRIRMTAEDAVRTQQYAENAMRKEACQGSSYEEFLESLNLKAKQVEVSDAYLERIIQLIWKTNQFNLTTIRYTRQDIENMLLSHYIIYAYKISDRFGDYGLVAVAIVDTEKVEIDTLLMSCRVMGKMVENFVVNTIEEDLLQKGYNILHAKYIPTAKNAPVADLFDKLGYKVTRADNTVTEYEIELENRGKRHFFVNVEN